MPYPPNPPLTSQLEHVAADRDYLFPRFPRFQSSSASSSSFPHIHQHEEESRPALTDGYSLDESVNSRLTNGLLVPRQGSALSTQQNTEQSRSPTMSLRLPSKKPPPLVMDLNLRNGSQGLNDSKQIPKTPGNKITSFFGWKSAGSPGAESSSTEISDSAYSPVHSPMAGSTAPPTYMSIFPPLDSHSPSQVPKMSNRSQTVPIFSDLSSRVLELENELREVSSELAGSIRREMELEDMVDRLQLAPNLRSDTNSCTSDYFSDSGHNSVKSHPGDAGNVRSEDIERVKRASEQERALLKAELSQRWQEERSRRQVVESHVQILESQVQQVCICVLCGPVALLTSFA